MKSDTSFFPSNLIILFQFLLQCLPGAAEFEEPGAGPSCCCIVFKASSDLDWGLLSSDTSVNQSIELINLFCPKIYLDTQFSWILPSEEAMLWSEASPEASPASTKHLKRPSNRDDCFRSQRLAVSKPFTWTLKNLDQKQRHVICYELLSLLLGTGMLALLT